ncbi:hypothetical protein [Cellulomonas fimi]|uniref:Uncharacterized protein n=1 Tax=Cellulomonas fimi (strain ATCC 484 / DSM 20113 / JCM 1341 / CCUG 24087 / LMG 16345 / NBRC 15513 / NCIMB 8980 / NCTC 7547 / NRS-133) TaxID=590998 RepID=F4H167_CELFA|nr:hypothetical protein [Cellulomonas fimi]AEE47436.1 hypothetical protein Celf_3322 [Cellulomonas fimi ATCC 484]VEH36212.1 Uncharacterised protein [Cellulomonas fimi]
MTASADRPDEPHPDDTARRPTDVPAGTGDDEAGPRPDDRALLGGGRVGLFGEALTVGLAVSVLSLPVVTALPALAAGVAHVRRHLSGRPDTLRDLWDDFRAACRGVWLVAVGSVALLLLLAFNYSLAGTGVLPGGTGVRVVSAAAAVSLLVALLRAAAGWAPGASWRIVLRDASRRTGDDLAGSGLLVLALALCGVIVWMLPPLVVVVPGLLALATVAVEHRALHH